MVCSNKKKSKPLTAFGLTIQSELELQELFTGQGQADVVITLGKAPKHLPQAVEQTPWYEAAKGKFLLRVEGVAAYYVENGNFIIIEPQNGASEELIRLFLLNSVFALLLQQRDYLTLHGATAVINGKAVAILGASTAGKSSIAFTLYHRGHELLSDEICAIRYKDGKAYVLPELPWLNIWKDTLTRAGIDEGAYKPIRQGIKKYVIPVGDRFRKEEAELAGIVLLLNHNRDGVNYELISGGSKLKKLVSCSESLDMGQDKVKKFQTLTAAGKARIVELSFNENLYPLDEIADIIETEWK